LDNAPHARPKAPASSRLDAVDWLRGLAVVLMIQTHLYDSWASPAAKLTEAYSWSRFLGGIPSRLFLLLVGVSMAIKFESQLAKGVERAAMVRTAVKRGFQIVLLAYLFRLQEYALGGWGDNWRDLYRIDILNCIGASMVAAGLIAAPRKGRPALLATLLAAAVFLGFGPIVGPAHFPDFLPKPLTSYIGGQRPMAWFPLFPWAAWVLVGVAIGHYWVRSSGDARSRAKAFVISGVAGLAMMGAVIVVRRINPYIIRYPSDVVQQMGPGAFFYRLGQMGVLALLAWAVTALTALAAPTWFSPMRQFGRTSLLVYWIHVDLCYGLVSGRIHHRLSMAWATVGFVLMTAAMLLVSVLKTKYWRGWRGPRAAPAVPTTPTAA
jgi:uncharacterized membrane protein